MAQIVNFGDLIIQYSLFCINNDLAGAMALLNAQGTRFPDQASYIAYLQICLAAKSGDTSGALRMLGDALDAGYWYAADALHGDADLAALQGKPQFESLVQYSQVRRDKAVSQAKPSMLTMEPCISPAPWPSLMALHGNLGQAQSFAAHWKAAVDTGWLVALPQSSQVSWINDAYDWNNIECALEEVSQHRESLQQRNIAKPPAVIAGFSMGGQIALRAALSDQFDFTGFILIEGWAGDLPTWEAIIANRQKSNLRGYLVTGTGNESVTASEKIRDLLTAKGITCELERATNVGHGFASEFDQTLKRALAFVSNTK